MTKADLIKEISEKTGNSKEDVSVIVENFIIVVKDSMADGNDVFIRKFGSFINKKRAAKLARDITKNIPVLVPEHFIPFFKPSPEFKEMIIDSNKLKDKLRI
jgi:DNA-binding protein HU-beta